MVGILRVTTTVGWVEYQIIEVIGLLCTPSKAHVADATTLRHTTLY